MENEIRLGRPAADFQRRMLDKLSQTAKICFACVLALLPVVWPVYLPAESGAAYSGSATWGGADYEQAYQVRTDSNGNVFVSGDFPSVDVDFDSGPSIDLQSSNGNNDVFLVKRTSAGFHAWTRTWGGISNDYAHGLAVDPKGNVYVTGQFAESVDFDPGLVVESYRALGSFDDFLTKYNSDGSYAWTRVWGSASYDSTLGVTADSNGNVYVVGFFQDTVDFDPGPGLDLHLMHEGSEYLSTDAFLTKYNSDGSYAWTRTWGGGSSDVAQSVTTDQSGNIYVAGYFGSTVDFDPGAGVSDQTSAGGDDAFLTKFSSDGAYVWSRTWGGSNGDYAAAVAAGPGGSLYVVGNFQSTVDFDPTSGIDPRTSNGQEDAFLTSYSSAGSYAWSRAWGGTQSDYSKDVTVGPDETVYVTGYFEGGADFNPGADSDDHTSAGGNDAFLAKYNSTGAYAWAKSWGGSGGDRANGITVDSNRNIHVAGGYQGLVDLDPGPGSDLQLSNGSADAFLIKFTPTCDLRGTIVESGVPLESVSVDGGPLGIRSTDAKGEYLFGAVLEGTSYTLTPSKSGYSFTPSSVSSVLMADTVENFAAQVDACPLDPAKNTPGSCGCGTPDSDLNGSGTPDCLDPEIAGLLPPRAKLIQKGLRVTAKLASFSGVRYVVSYRLLTGDRARDRRARIRTVESSSPVVRIRRANSGLLLALSYRYALGTSPVTQSLKSRTAKLYVR